MVVVCSLLVSAATWVPGGNVGENVGSLLEGYAGDLCGGIVAVLSLVLVWSRRYTGQIGEAAGAAGAVLLDGEIETVGGNYVGQVIRVGPFESAQATTTAGEAGPRLGVRPATRVPEGHPLVGVVRFVLRFAVRFALGFVLRVARRVRVRGYLRSDGAGFPCCAPCDISTCAGDLS